MDEANKKLRFLILSSEIIKNTYLKQCDREVSRLLSLEPEFDWNIITEVDLSFLDVVHICNFTLITNLKCLRLAQNKIQKIENLDRLTKLEKLDISYNKISKIENLEKLTALKFISLSGNKISKLENLDAIVQLQTLFINENKITDFNELLYLTRFKDLRVLDVMNNPATEYLTLGDYEEKMQLKNVKFSNLQYLNSKLVPNSMINLPVNELKYNHHALAQVPDGTNLNRQDILNDVNGKQFIHYVYKDDYLGLILSKFNRNVQEAFLVYKKEVMKNAVTLNTICLKKLDDQEDKSLKFKMAYYTFEKEWTNKSRKLIREHDEITQKRIKVREESDEDSGIIAESPETSIIYQALDLDPVASLSKEFEEELMALTDRLHLNNIYMNESIMSMIYKYEGILDDELKLFTESIATIYSNIREAENDFSHVLMENIKMTVNNRQKVIPEEVMNHFKNRFDILDTTSESTEKHLDRIYKHEENINSITRKWTKKTMDDLKHSEKRRFWMVIEEIRIYKQTNTHNPA